MNTSIAKVVTFTLALAGSACLPPVATAAAETPHGPAGAASAPVEAPRIEAFAVRNTSIERLRVTVNVGAPVERVRAVIFDYGHYPEFMPRYEKAAVLKIAPDGARLVQMELGGIVRLWMRVDISAPVQRGATEAYEGRLVGGNVKAFVPRWELTPLADGRTRVMVESFMDPGLALVPSSLINSGARDGMREAMVALKARIEGRAAR